MSVRRDALTTRSRLLRAAFEEFHRNGYGGSDLRAILERAGVTKGALYHHFRGKRALAYAVIEELLHEWVVDRWLRPLAGVADPLNSIVGLARWGERVATTDSMALGCPLDGLSHELCGKDEGFRKRLVAIYEEWQGGLEDLLRQAQQSGRVRVDADVSAAAAFIVAAWQGAIGMAQAHASPTTLHRCRLGLEAYLETLRPTETEGPREIA